MFISMDFDKTLKDFIEKSADFSRFLKVQKEMKSVAKLSLKTIPKLKLQVKELRRKERLKTLHLDYMKILSLTADFRDGTKSPFVSSEIQIKQLVKHQEAFLNELGQMDLASSQARPNIFPCISYSLFKNPLLNRIKAVVEPESKLFRPEANNCAIRTIFFHDERGALMHKERIKQDLEVKLMAFANKGQINGKISRMVKIDSDYRKSYEKVVESVKRIGFLVKKPLFPQANLAAGSSGIESSRIRHKSSRFSQIFSEDSLEASTSRSSSANHRRLGFFFSCV